MSSSWDASFVSWAVTGARLLTRRQIERGRAACMGACALGSDDEPTSTEDLRRIRITITFGARWGKVLSTSVDCLLTMKVRTRALARGVHLLGAKIDMRPRPVAVPSTATQGRSRKPKENAEGLKAHEPEGADPQSSGPSYIPPKTARLRFQNRNRSFEARSDLQRSDGSLDGHRRV